MAKISRDMTCRLCGQANHEILLPTKKTADKEYYRLLQCLSCQFVTVYPLPSVDTLKKYYSAEYWPPPRGTADESVDKFYAFRMRPVLRFLEQQHPPPGRLLDWGAGNGDWLKLTRKAGYEAIGIDQYCAEPDSKYLINGDIENTKLQPAFFDIITCFHVLEHLADPVQNFNAALEKLKPQGIMIIEVPNIQSWGFKFFRSAWQPLELPTHLNHFSPETLIKIITGSGRVEILRQDFFSLRASPATFVLSLFPCLTPKKVRKYYSGRYPLPHKLIYLLLQLAAIPICWIAAIFKRGSIMRLTILKKG